MCRLQLAAWLLGKTFETDNHGSPQMGHVVGKRAVLPTQVQLLDGKDSAMNQELSENMDLAGMSKDQLVGLCNALYSLLQQRQAPAPTFVFPSQPTVQPFVAPYNPWPPFGTVICNSTNESTQQERFGSR